MKDIKPLLKEAREAIKNKNYEQSLKLCKQILREDKENYNALVFTGLSLQETGQGQKAVNAFQAAIKVNASNSLAWTGLANYFEKVDEDEAKKELVNVYMNLIKIETAEKKVCEYVEKLTKLANYADFVEIANNIYALTQQNEHFQTSTEIWVSLAFLFASRKNSIPPELSEIQEQTLKNVINNQKTVCTEYYADYLALLYKQNRTNDVLSNAKKMHALFERDWISLRWLCKVFNEHYVEHNGKLIESIESMANYADKLSKLENPSATALFTQSILIIERDADLIGGLEKLSDVVKILPGMLHAWILLLKCSIKLQLFSDAINASNKINKMLENAKDARLAMKNEVNLLILEGLSKSEDGCDLQEAINVYQTLSDDAKLISMTHVIRAYISLGLFAQAEDLLSQIKNEEDFDLLKAQLLRKQSKYREAIDILEKREVNTTDWLIQLGCLYTEIGAMDKSLMPFLRAAKLDATNFKCFLHLGHYYQNVGDANKARRCYEKAFKLNNKCAEAGMELSKIYRKLKNWENNLALLQSLTAGVINKRNCWAWMQLGLHYLEQEEYDKAVNSLRFVVRIDEQNAHCWESLADGYLAKGAYTSALKCYEKALEQNARSLYPLLQTATIKHILGEFVDAREIFERILEGNKCDVLAMKGMAETCMSQAWECFRSNRFGSARDHAQVAADKLIGAIENRSDLGCLWKLLGDACVFVTKLPEQAACLHLPTAFVEGKVQAEGVQSKKIVEKEDLFDLASKCYCKSINLISDNILIWHDLGACYLKQALNARHGKRDELLKKARSVAEYCTVKNATNSEHWNLLGNVAFNSKPANYKLAQHAFIKSVIADNNNAAAWCNLGTLYMVLGDFKLANEAFSQAQRADPNYINSWIGQALLAENFGHGEEAMDLFRHSTQLGMHQQGALGYGHWVCKTLKETPMDVRIYAIHNMHAIPVACDYLTWYTEHNPMDGSAWNLLGMLRERMGLTNGALQAFKNALALCDEQYRDLARINFARLLTKAGNLSQAIEMFNSVKSATFNSGSGLALALFKDSQYKESYEAYESSLHWLTDEQTFQSDLLTALAAMAFMFEGPEAAQTLLYQSIQLERASPFGFFATLALAILYKDGNLSQLVFKEMSRLKDEKNCIEHYATLCGYLYLMQGSKAVREISKLVHRHPDQAAGWLVLASFLVRTGCQAEAAAKCAQIAMKLGQATMDVTKVLCLVSLSAYMAGDAKTALIAAQKAVHCYPNVPEAFAVFATALAANEKRDNVKNVLNHLKILPLATELATWTKKTIILF